MKTFLVQREQPDGSKVYLTTRRTWAAEVTEGQWFGSEEVARRQATAHNGKVVTLDQIRRDAERKTKVTIV